MSLKGKVGVVTGGGSGIGRAISMRLAQDGIAVAVWDLNGTGAGETVKMIKAAGGRALACTVDAADAAQIAAALSKTRAELGPVTILINNAGIAEFVRVEDITEEAWDRMMVVNLKGPFLCTQAVLPDMRAAKWGRIVNISSSSVQVGASKMSHYVASKGGVIGLTRALAIELASEGITVNTVPPSFIDTPMLRAAPIDHKAHAETVVPVKRAGRPENIAAACAFLVSEDADYVTGQTISVNGGRYMG